MSKGEKGLIGAVALGFLLTCGVIALNRPIVQVSYVVPTPAPVATATSSASISPRVLKGASATNTVRTITVTTNPTVKK